MKKSFIVYLHRCLVAETTNGIYIGITSRLPEQRWDNGNGYLHINKVTGEYAQPKIAYTILKHAIINWNNPKVWEHQILFTGLTKLEAEKKEIELINYFDSYNNGLNSTKGGNGFLKYDTEEERLDAIKVSRDKAHIKWNNNQENLIKNQQYHHTSYLRTLADQDKYKKRLEQKKAANSKRKQDQIKCNKDKLAKQQSQTNLRKIVKETRQQIISFYNKDETILTDEQFKIVFEKSGSHYKRNSAKKLGEILENIKSK